MSAMECGILSIINDCVLDVLGQYKGVSPSLVTTYGRSRYRGVGTLTNITWTQLGDGLWVPVFNGATSYISFPDTPAYRFTNSCTLLTWAKFAAIDINQNLFSKAGGANNFGLKVLPTTNLLRLDWNNGGWQSASGTIPMTTGIWHFIVTTVDFSLGSNQIKHYHQGELDNQTTNANAMIAQAANVVLGVEVTTPTAPLNGNMALSSMYNFALSAAQVRARYHSTKWLFGVPV